jgi:hypothetical protein
MFARKNKGTGGEDTQWDIIDRHSVDPDIGCRGKPDICELIFVAFRSGICFIWRAGGEKN